MGFATWTLPDISRWALCYHCNETRTPIADPLNSAQLEGTPTIPSSYIRVRAVVCKCDEGHTDTQTAVTTIHFASSTTHAKCNDVMWRFYDTIPRIRSVHGQKISVFSDCTRKAPSVMTQVFFISSYSYGMTW